LTLYQELQAGAADIPVALRLGSATNAVRVTDIVASEAVDIIIHAAAYAQSLLSFENALESARNNVLSTQVVAGVALDQAIERLIMISTDQADQPDQTHGAIARLKELVVQDHQARSKSTSFAVVRFGPVLGSVGSLVPLLQRQILQGGPVTIAHPDQARHFMTRTQAARLVLLSGCLQSEGEVFSLDKGAPQKIVDVAHRLIEMSDNQLLDPITGAGDIAIEFTGARPGEHVVEPSTGAKGMQSPTSLGGVLKAYAPRLSEIEVASLKRKLEGCASHADLNVLCEEIMDLSLNLSGPAAVQQQAAFQSGQMRP